MAMLNRLVNLIRPGAVSDRPLQAVAEIASTDLRDLALGARVNAEVAATLQGGTYQIAIGNRIFNVRLPINAAPGDVLNLMVIAREPWPEFALAPPEQTGVEITTLSATGRFITDLLAAGDKLPLAGTTQFSGPLLSTSPGDTHTVALALQQALMESGMFYESHQAQWVAGERSITQLLQEPQGRLAPIDPAPTKADEVNRQPPVHPEAMPIVKQQLEVLESRHLVWHGQIWSQQDLQWEISEQLPHATRLPGARAWKTRLRLIMPRLGEVSATLAFDAQGVDIVLAAHQALTADTLTAAIPVLRRALHGAGLMPTSLTVGHVEAGHG